MKVNSVFMLRVIRIIKGICRKVKYICKLVKNINNIYPLINQEEYLSKEYLQNNTYECLEILSKINIKLWRKGLNKIEKSNIDYLKKKTQPIRIAFLCNLAATWSCDVLFNKLLVTERYSPYIIVHHFYNGTPITIEENYVNTYNFFIKKGYEVYGDTDKETKEFLGLSDLGNPDIIFHLSPYNMAFPDKLNIINYPLNILNINIPYGIYVAELDEAQYRLDSFSMYWKIFDLPFYCKNAEKYTKLSDFNRVPSGYCKLDSLYDDINKDSYIGQYWNDRKRTLKIIYAPHHSIGDMGQKFSTFDQNYEVIYELAEQLEETTSWVYKPHPLLKKATVQAGVFENEEQYDEYERKWNDLKNGCVVTGGDYFPLFQTSDCMILDSDSFLAEYQYVDKPILLLSRDSQKFSDLGIPLSRTLYRVNGDDKKGIKNFIECVCMNKEDPLASERKAFFEEYLDYKKQNNCMASEYIYKYINSFMS